jgi:hypothetical protein
MLAKVCSQLIGVYLILGKRLKFESVGEIRKFSFLAVGRRGGLNRCGLSVDQHRLYNKEINHNQGWSISNREAMMLCRPNNPTPFRNLH